jgi:hypothetical protein
VEINRYAGRVPDAVIAHDSGVPADLMHKYQSEKAYPVYLNVEDLQQMGVKRVKISNLMSTTSLVRHDPQRTAQALFELFEEIASNKKPNNGLKKSK